MLATGRPEDVPFAINQQLSFVVEDLDQLRTVRNAAKAADSREIWQRSHGNAWSVYLNDPDKI